MQQFYEKSALCNAETFGYIVIFLFFIIFFWKPQKNAIFLHSFSFSSRCKHLATYQVLYCFQYYHDDRATTILIVRFIFTIVSIVKNFKKYGISCHIKPCRTNSNSKNKIFSKSLSWVLSIETEIITKRIILFA